MPIAFGDLPVDCVYSVVKYLSPRDRLLFEPINRTFGQAIRLAWDKQRVIRVDAETPVARSHFFNCNNEDHQARQCDTISRTYYSDQSIVRLIQRCKNLIAFEWNAMGNLPRDIYTALMSSKKLEHIYTAADFVDNKGLTGFPVKCLLFNDVFPNFELSDNLETVCFQGEIHPQLEAIRSELIKLSSIKKLVFNFTGDTMDEDENIIYTQLCNEQDGCMFEDVDVLTNLESISLSLCSHFSYLETMPNLTELVIHSDSLDSSFPEHVKMYGQQIKSVQIKGFSRQFLNTLFEYAPNIEKLSIDDNLINEIMKYNLTKLRLIEVIVHTPQHALLTPLIKKLLENSPKLRTIIIPISKQCKINMYANVLMKEVCKYAIRYPKRQFNAIIGAYVTVDLPPNINYRMHRVNYKRSHLHPTDFVY